MNFPTLTPELIGSIGTAITAVIIAFRTNKMLSFTQKIKTDLELLKNHFEVQKTKEDFKIKLNEIKNHYVGVFVLENYIEAAQEKGTAFVNIIEHILDIYEMNIGNYDNIIRELDKGADDVRKAMILALGTEKTMYFYCGHGVKYIQFKHDIEGILATTKNHYMERFVDASIAFMQAFMRELKQIEKEEINKEKESTKENGIKANR